MRPVIFNDIRTVATSEFHAACIYVHHARVCFSRVSAFAMVHNHDLDAHFRFYAVFAFCSGLPVHDYRRRCAGLGSYRFVRTTAERAYSWLVLACMNTSVCIYI